MLLSDIKIMNVHSGNLLSRLLGVSLIALVLTSCIRPEAPNAEADILSVEIEGITTLSEPVITNNSVTMRIKPVPDRSALKASFTLTPGATISPEDGTPQDFSSPVKYTVTSEDGQWSKDYTITLIDDGPMTSFFNFEETKRYEVTEGDERYQIFTLPDGGEWSSPNPGFMITLGIFPPTKDQVYDPYAYPVCSEEQGYVGKCAKMRTLSTGEAGMMFGSPIAAGTLYLGTFGMSLDPLKSTHFGVPEKRIPLRMSGYYKYSSGDVFTVYHKEEKKQEVIEGKRDLFELYAILFETDEETPSLDGTNIKDSPNIVLKAHLDDARESDDWVHFDIPFNPQNGKTIDPQKLADGKYKFTIVMTSSKDGATFSGAVGSTLLVDEVKVTFQESSEQ